MKKEAFKFSKTDFTQFYKGYLGPNIELTEDLLNANGLMIKEEKDDPQLIAAINQALNFTVDVAIYTPINGQEVKMLVDFFATNLAEKKTSGWIYLVKGLLHCYLHDVIGLEEVIENLKSQEVDNILIFYLKIKAALHKYELKSAKILWDYVDQLEKSSFINLLFFQLEGELTNAIELSAKNRRLNYDDLHKRKLTNTYY